MAFENRRYLIIPASKVAEVDFTQVLETSAETCRYSVDGTQTFVKYELFIREQDEEITQIEGDTGEESTVILPAGIYGRPSIYEEGDTEYTHAEILEILAGEEWTTPMDEEGV